MKKLAIKYLKNNEINFVRWDNCINNAINGNIFAYSWYLNILSEDWDALVMGNYDYVMPILHTTKFNRNVTFSSKLGNRLGIFSAELITEEIIQEFISNIPKKFQVINLIFNKFNKLGKKTASLKTYEMDLIRSYPKVKEKYSGYFRKSLDVAVSKKISLVKGITPNEIINFAYKKGSVSKPRFNKIEIQKFRMIIAYGIRYNLIDMYGAYTAQNNLCAIAVFMKSKRKIHLIFNAISREGLESFALHYLIDKFIDSHSEKTLTLNIENVITRNDVDFFSGVGAYEYKYERYYVNHLPWYYKFLIKTD